MSGYCPDCGNTQCICKEVERQENRLPPVRVDSIVGVLVGACNDALNHFERGQYMQQSDEATTRVMEELQNALHVYLRFESEKHTND